MGVHPPPFSPLQKVCNYDPRISPKRLRNGVFFQIGLKWTKKTVNGPKSNKQWTQKCQNSVFGQKNLFFGQKRCGIGGAPPGAQLLADGVPMAAEAVVPAT